MEEKLLNITFQNLDIRVPGCVMFSKEASTNIFQSHQCFNFYFGLTQHYTEAIQCPISPSLAGVKYSLFLYGCLHFRVLL